MIDPPVLQRCRLDQVKVDHFLDFVSSTSFLQDVAYGAKNLKLSDGHTIQIPNVVRTVVAFRLVLIRLSGLDSTQTDGVEGFTSLDEALQQIRFLR